MNFIFEWQHSILGTSAVLFSPRENKVHTSSRRVMFFLLYRQKEHGRTRNAMTMILYTAREIQREKKSTTPHLLIILTY